MSARPFFLVALTLSTIAGCGGPNRGDAYVRAVAEARRNRHDGRFDAAATKYDEAAKSATIPRDALYARYEAALLRAQAFDVARSAAELRAIARSKPPTEYSAQAAFKAAELAMASDEAAGLAELETVVVDFPDSGVARVALARLLRHDDTAGPEAALAHLDALLPRVRDKKVEEKARYERARRLEALARIEPARDAYLEVAAKWAYPFGAFNDDALFRAADIEESLGRPNEAIAILERLLSQREVSSFMGSYERPRYLPAALRIASLFEEKLGDRASARTALYRVYRDFTTSTMRDDALWREAELWRKDGNPSTACKRLETLASEFPDSRYVPCATRRCPNIVRPSKSRAPAVCHDYLIREPGAAPRED